MKVRHRKKLTMLSRGTEYSLFKKCDRCGQKFQFAQEHQMRQWTNHRMNCNRPSFHRQSLKQKRRMLPFCQTYYIEDGFKSYNYLPSHIAECLHKYHICVIDNYIGNEVAIGVKNETSSLVQSPKLVLHRKGKYKAEKFDSELVYWLTGEERAISYIKILKRSLNLLLTSIKFEDTPKITSYTRFQISCNTRKSPGVDVHVDNVNDNGSLLTVVYYCNEKYSKSHGGEERFFLYDLKSVVDVEPKFNRLVIYWSDFRVAHGTCKSFKDLVSLKAWYLQDKKEVPKNTPK